MAALTDNVGLLFRIKADSSDAEKDFKKFKKELQDIEDAGKDPLARLAQGAGLTAQQFDNLKVGAMAAATGVTAVAAAAAVAVTAVVAVGVGLFKMAESASEAGSELKDMQDKTGLAAVTLSALKLAADNSGSSFEQVGGSVAKFAKLLGQASEGNEKALASLKALNVNTTDLDTGLKQVFKSIANATDGTEQMNLAFKAFGKSGVEMIPVIKQVNGELEAAEKEARKLGIALTESDIRAADEFGDTLGTLSRQVRSLTNQFALQFAPIITSAMNQVVVALARNKDAVRSAGENFANVLRGMQSVASSSTVGMIGSFAAWAAKIISYIDPVQNAIFLTIRALNLLGINTPKGAGTAQEGGGFVASASGIPSISPGGGGGKGGGRAASAGDPNRKAIQDIQTANGQALSAYKALLDAQSSELKQSLNLRLISEVNYAKAIAELKLKELLFEQQQNEKLLKDERLSNEERKEAENKKLILIRKVAQARIDIGNEVYEAIKKQTEKELKDLEKKLEDEERIRQKARDKANAAADVDLQNKIKKRDAREKRDPYNTGNPQRGANGELDWQVPAGGDFITGVVDALGAANEQLPIMQQLGQQLAATFGQVAQAVGAAVRSFVLFGTAGQSFRKFAAEVIASIAQMSIVQAVFELAQGFAMLALAWFTGNPKYKKSAVDHFTAAAVFGAIGGVAAGVGRGVAGDSFKNQSDGGGNSGGSGGGAAGQPERLNFTERFNGFQQQLTDQMARVMQRTNEVLGGVTEAVDTFNQKFGITTPGAVVMAGAGDAGEAIFGAVTGHLDSDLRAGSNFIRSQGKME